MNRIWQGLMCVGVVALWQPPALGAAPLLTAADAEQPAPPAPAAPATPPAPPRHRGPVAARPPRSGAASDRPGATPSAVRGSTARPSSRQFKGGEGITLDLLNMLGDVVVVGGKGREGRLSIVRRVQGRGPETDALLKAFEIDVSEHANRVAVRSSMPRPSQPPQRGARPRVRADYRDRPACRDRPRTEEHARQRDADQRGRRRPRRGHGGRCRGRGAVACPDAPQHVRRRHAVAQRGRGRRQPAIGERQRDRLGRPGRLADDGHGERDRPDQGIRVGPHTGAHGERRHRVRVGPAQGRPVRAQDARRGHLRLRARRQRVRVRGQHVQGRRHERRADPAGDDRLPSGPRQRR